MGVREELDPVTGRNRPSVPQPTIVGYSKDGQPMVMPPGMSMGPPITLAEYQAAVQARSGMSGPQRFGQDALAAMEQFAGAGGMGATSAAGMMIGKRGSNPAGLRQVSRSQGEFIPAGAAPNATRANAPAVELNMPPSAPTAAKADWFQVPAPPAARPPVPPAGVSAPGAVSPQWAQGGGAAGGVSAPGAMGVSAPGAVRAQSFQVPPPPAGRAGVPSAGVSAPGAVPPGWSGPPAPPAGVSAPGAMGVQAPGAVSAQSFQVPPPPMSRAPVPPAGVSAPGAVPPGWAQPAGAPANVSAPGAAASGVRAPGSVWSDSFQIPPPPAGRAPVPSSPVSAPGSVPPGWVGPPAPSAPPAAPSAMPAGSPGVSAPGATWGQSYQIPPPPPGRAPVPPAGVSAPGAVSPNVNRSQAASVAAQRIAAQRQAPNVWGQPAPVSPAGAGGGGVPSWAKGLGFGAAGAGAAYLAGRDSGEASAPEFPWQPSKVIGEPIADALAKLQQFGNAQPDASPTAEPTATPPPVAPPPAAARPRGASRPMGSGRGAAGGSAQAGAGSSPGQQAGGGFAIGQNPRAPAANYYSDMLGAADSGDAYARDLVNLTSQARQVAFKANQEGKHLQFVPLHDMRSNRLFLVNANGQDVVLDLNDEGDKAAFGRMTAKIGIDPASIMAWAQKSSRPLHRYMVPPGSQGDWAPQFGEPGSQAPQVGAQPPAAQEPQASPAPFQLPQVPHYDAGQPLPSMQRGLNVNADRPTDARFAEIEALRGQGLGGSQLDEQERKLRELRASNPTAYARGLGG